MIVTGDFFVNPNHSYTIELQKIQKGTMINVVFEDEEGNHLGGGDYIVDEDVDAAIITDKDEEGLDILRATAAFLLEAVAKRKYPELRLGMHEADEGGFFVDTDKEDQIRYDVKPAQQDRGASRKARPESDNERL